jgi:hypothetical protein
VIDPRERLEEYVDGLLTPEETRQVEEALANDAGLRAELDSVRRFAGMMEGLSTTRPRLRILPWATLAAAAAALFLWINRPAPEDPVMNEIRRDWDTFGQRLAKMAVERREGRVSRTGLSDLEVPPAKAFGLVYGAGLDELGIELSATERAQAERLVTRHFVALRSLPETVEGEWKRSESSLEVYRQLRDVAGRAAADAYYDLFRPGLVDRATVERLEDGAFERVLKDRADYVAAYVETCRKLERRYGESTLNVVLARLAPNDRRLLRRDATQDGAAPDAVLSIRAELYRVAAETGADRLYVDLG